MPPIYRIICDTCGKVYGKGWGSIMYVADDDVLSVSELKGERRPACKEGTVVWMDTGMRS